jgi:pilus assembly protein CpaB
MLLMKTKLVVYLAVTFSFLASLSIFLYLRGINVETVLTAEPYRDIVVVAADIKAGIQLTEENLEVLSWPERLVPAGSFERSEDVVGKTVARNFIAGEPILSAHLTRDGTGDGIASLTPPGMRAMTISVSSNAMVSEFLNPNSRVDVLATIQTDKKGGGYISKSILQNVRVLSVGNGAGGGIGMSKWGSVTLLVTPDEAERLALAENQGVLYLVMRNITDQDSMTTEGTTISSLLETGKERVVEKKADNIDTNVQTEGKPSPTARRTSREEKVRIEVIRGMEREEMVFDNP